MLVHPQFDPIAIDLGPIKVHWYGIMYLVAFALAWWLGRVRARRPGSGWREQEVGDLIYYGAIGVILGGRIGYVLFYNLDLFLRDPLMIFRVWEGGMSFHGGLIGVILAMAWFARRTHRPFLAVADFVAPLVPLGYAAGRLGNFINGELWGRPTDVPWAMVFPQVDALPRHPSQLYQALVGGVLVFAVLWWYARRPRPLGAVAGLYLALAGSARFFNEFFREPDPQLGYIAFGWMTMGQLLSLPMILAGVGLMAWAYRRARGERAS